MRDAKRPDIDGHVVCVVRSALRLSHLEIDLWSCEQRRVTACLQGIRRFGEAKVAKLDKDAVSCPVKNQECSQA